MNNSLNHTSKTYLAYYKLSRINTCLFSKECCGTHNNINQHLDEIRLQQSNSMRNHYKFQDQIKSMQQLFQTNIFIAQIANTLLDKIPHQLVELAAKELNFFYQEKYLREDEEKYQQIKMTLNIIAKNKACNIDELFMNLGTQINNYYENDYLHLQKRKPYLKQCRFCKKNASNYMNGLRQHEYKCKDNPEGKYQFPIDKKVKRFDTKESYQKRQSKLQQRSHQQFIEIDQQAVNHLAKKKSSKRRKRQDKQQALILYCQKQSHAREKEIYDGFDDQNEVYHQENDEQLIKQSRNRLDIQGISTINPTVRDFQLLENEPQENKKIQEENQNQFLE